MNTLLGAIALIWILAGPICLLWVWLKKRKAAKQIEELTAIIAQRDDSIAQRDDSIERIERARDELLAQLALLEKYQHIIDIEAVAKSISDEASQLLEQARQNADQIRQTANQSAKVKIEQVEKRTALAVEEAAQTVAAAKQKAEEIRQTANQTAKVKIEQAEQRTALAFEEAAQTIAAAKQKAEEIAGDAFAAMNRSKEFTDTAKAMKNLIEGYGDAYIVPTYSLLDDLAEEFGFTEAGQNLKAARDVSRGMVKQQRAAACDYAETNRRETATRFVVDAFNGKVDTILSRTKADNHGTLAQQIRDAFSLVNHNGNAFRNARITDQYLDSRLNELKWAAIANALKDEEREKQRELREQMREEEKARREYERAIKEAAKEEDSLRKAMEKAQQQVAAASDAQRAEFEAKLLDLQSKLQAAEEKNQRALSMAQQTRTGHVYIISNIGSFGEEVFKIGMTRRLEPNDRIRELGDASVPFEFDVHAMIFNEDAPALEKTLHRHFLRQQVNKVNPRKEFFRLNLADIRSELETLGVETQWTMTAAAHQYRESLRIEQQIFENPAIAAEWSQHQLEEVEAEEEIEETA